MINLRPNIKEVYRYSFSWELNFDLLPKMPVYKKEKNQI